MSIEILHEIPSMEHDEDLGGYAYPEEFRNKLFVFGDQYIYIKSGTYESYPKPILDALIKDALSSQQYESVPIDYDQVKSIIQTEMVNYEEKFQNLLVEINLEEKLPTLIQELLPDSIDNKVNSVIDAFSVRLEEMNEQLYEKPSLEDVNAKFVQTLERLREKTNSLTEESSTSTIDESRLFQLKIQMENYVQSELQTVYDNMDRKIAELVEEKMKDVVSTSNDLPQVQPNPIFATLSKIPDTNRINQLVLLKSAGYTIEEIKVLAESSLI